LVSEEERKAMKTLVKLLIPVAFLAIAGCVVVPAHYGYYGPHYGYYGPRYVVPAPVVVVR
jgi:hypothetical protein